jgi:hypothetical protein
MDAALIAIALTLAAQAGWSPDRYDTPPAAAVPPPAAAPTYDRYQAAPTGTTNGVNPPPSVTDRARNAATETATTLREGFEAGVQAANQQFSQGSQQLYENTRTAGQEFADGFQNWAGSTTQEFAPIGTAPRPIAGQASNTRGQVSNPFAPVAPAQPAAAKSRNGVAPPPWAGATPTTEPDWGGESLAPINIDRTAALGAGPVRTGNGWTNVSSHLAPPTLRVPRLVNTVESVAAPQQGTAAGPSFPIGFANQPPAERRAAAQTQQQSPPAANADDGWALGWGNSAQPVTIGRYDTQPAASNAQQPQGRLQADPVAARPQSPQNTQQVAQGQAQNPQFDPWGANDPWDDPIKGAQGTQGTQQPASAGAAAQSPAETGSAQVAAGTVGQPPVGPQNVPTNALTQPAPPIVGSASANTPKTGDEPPWVPLLVVSLSLAGSIGANLFLGWSYMDARQKYRSLVQKTANTFRRATAAA